MYDIGFIGFGEAAQAFTTGWRNTGSDLSIAAYDILFDEGIAIPACDELAVTPVPSAAELRDQSNCIVAAVTHRTSSGTRVPVPGSRPYKYKKSSAIRPWNASGSSYCRGVNSSRIHEVQMLVPSSFALPSIRNEEPPLPRLPSCGSGLPIQSLRPPFPHQGAES